MQYALSQRSRDRLHGVHRDLVKVVERAIQITDIDFTVLEGMRTLDRQKQLVAQGASKTMNSRHLTGHAVDLAPFVNGQVSWDWPLYHRLAKVIKRAAKEVGVALEWGGDWKSFKDGPHWQLPWKAYPANVQLPAAKYTGETENQASAKAIAAVGAGASVATPVAADPIIAVVDALTGQQDALSSGDVVRIIVAVIVVAAAGYFAWRKLRATE